MRLLRASLPAAIEIRKDFAIGDDQVLADATQINQVILNLVTNAVQAMNTARGRLDIKLQSIEVDEKTAALLPGVVAGCYLELTVADTGHGIADAIIERIFDPFFTTKGRGEGTGMGLSVVHGIVKDHGGFVRVKSRLEVGTSFQVILPRFDGVSYTTPVVGPIVGGNEGLLLIDDDEKEVAHLPERAPDLGPAKPHPTAGATIVSAGKRNLVAINILLNTEDLEIGKKIAKMMRAPSGGFSTIRAVAFKPDGYNNVAVSMNMFDITQTPIYRVFQVIENEAKRYGLCVVGTQICGTLPQEALINCAEYFLRLVDFNYNQIIENNILAIK